MRLATGHAAASCVLPSSVSNKARVELLSPVQTHVSLQRSVTAHKGCYMWYYLYFVNCIYMYSPGRFIKGYVERTCTLHVCLRARLLSPKQCVYYVALSLAMQRCALGVISGWTPHQGDVTCSFLLISEFLFSVMKDCIRASAKMR